MKFCVTFIVLFALSITILLPAHAFGQSTQVKYLSGTGSNSTVDWEFMVSGCRQSGKWTAIPVPSNWEMQGFGSYRYYDDWSSNPAPDSVGYYSYRFTIPYNWQNKKIDIVFGGSMTDTEVKINGRLAGPVHQGGFYEFRYDVTELVHTDKVNLLEVKVAPGSRQISRSIWQSGKLITGSLAASSVQCDSKPSRRNTSTERLLMLGIQAISPLTFFWTASPPPIALRLRSFSSTAHQLGRSFPQLSNSDRGR